MPTPHAPWKYLDVFTAVFIACLLAANIVGVKPIMIGPFVMPAGTIVFPISYIVNDILTEVYGLRQAKRVIWLGFLANLLLVLTILAAQVLPGAPFWQNQVAFEQVLGFAPRLLLASFVAYLIGSYANAHIMARMKLLTNERWLWMRTIGSTIVGEGLDSIVFIVIAFTGQMPFVAMASAAITVWLIKTLYEIVATPLTYFSINKVKQAETIHKPGAGHPGQIAGLPVYVSLEDKQND